MLPVEPQVRSARPHRTVRAVDRALSILDAFNVPSTHLSLVDLVARTGLAKPTVYRLVLTLVSRGYLERIGQGYEVGLRCFVLGNIFRDGIDLRTRALSHLIALRDASGASVQLAVLSGANIVYLERVFSERPVGYVRSKVGAVLPAYCTGLGKALLAFQRPEELEGLLRTLAPQKLTPNTIIDLDELRRDLLATRARGFAIDAEERQVGVRCIAAPIFDHSGQCVAAISISAPPERLPHPISTSDAVEVVCTTAVAISRAMGFTEHDATDLAKRA